MCDCYLVWKSIVTIIFYILDVASDTANGAFLIQGNKPLWGIATLILVFLPAIFNMFLVVYAYSSCFVDAQARTNYENMLLDVPWIRREAGWKTRWMHYILIFFRLEPIYSHVKLMKLGVKKSGDKHDYEFKTMTEMFLEVCLQSLPQIILQTYILGREPTLSGIQLVSLFISLSKIWWVVTIIDFKRGTEKCQTRWWWWIVKMLWCVFSAMTFLVSAFTSVSLFASVYNPFFLIFQLLGIFLFLIKWWWWRDSLKRRCDDLKMRSILGFVVAIIKTIFIMLTIIWYIRVKSVQKEFKLNSFISPMVKMVIPHNIWPKPNLCFNSWANISTTTTPDWAVCDRQVMYRNGTFVVDTRRFVANRSVSDNIFDFIKEQKLFCLIDLADIIFVIIFYSLLISFFWDICYFIIRIFVNPDEHTSESYNPSRIHEVSEERIRLKNTDGNANDVIQQNDSITI